MGFEWGLEDDWDVDWLCDLYPTPCANAENSFKERGMKLWKVATSVGAVIAGSAAGIAVMASGNGDLVKAVLMTTIVFLSLAIGYFVAEVTK